MTNRFRITTAVFAELEKILELQKRSFLTQAKLYNDYQLPPLLQTLEEIHSEWEKKVFLVANIDNAIIGSIRGYENNGTCFVERLFVDPEYRGNGIGLALLQEIENHFPQAVRFELFTGHKSENNIRMYESNGYRKIHEKPIHKNLTVIYFEKTVS